jgi:plastocyanin
MYGGLSFLAVAMLSGIRTPAARANEPAVVIKMIDVPASFEPAEVTINVGDTIRWENVGQSVHHAGSNPSTAINSSDVANPEGANFFDSGLVKPGESFSYTFTKPGTYKYVCIAHEGSGMLGQVTVR